MMLRKVFIYFLIVLLIVSPASAAGVSLNRWVLNVTVHDDGLVEELIQAEFENSGSVPLDGFSFVIPASKIAVIRDFYHTTDSTGEVEQQTVPDGLRVIVNFNKPVEAGTKWNGRVGFTAENWAVKTDSNYSIDIPVESPQVISSGKSAEVSVPVDADIRSQVFLPKSVELISVEPPPFRKLFQYGRMVPTWSPEKLHIGDVIRIKGSYSDVLHKIVEVDDRSRSLSTRIKEAKEQGKNVSEAEGYVANANDYNNNQALAFFWEKKYSDAQKYAGYANDELNKAENSLAAPAESTPEPTEVPRSPGFMVPALVIAAALAFLVSRKQ
ncbi:MAG: hypothetical protein OIN66_01400 [Candidatus Methanoperedens sp.]|nr:hypothetical protein [Candidatus Methanoperedens sp.]